MCDAWSMISAMGSLFEGDLANRSAKANAISAEAGRISAISAGVNAKSRTALEVAQMEASIYIGTAQARDQETELRKSFGDQMRANVSSMAISGMAFGSFDSVVKGNETELQDEVARIDRNDRLNQKAGEIAIEERKISGKFEEMGFKGQSLDSARQAAALRGQGAAAMFAGTMGAFKTIWKGEVKYNEVQSESGATEGERRWSYFKKSVGAS